ncbi:MAG TPA: DMT family transporter [Chitinophaga sp.]|uniref:EamA family transporter n=1 Tax=Chitinophaga sp. TaxID=1869181 RepID=UPI002B9FE106|nr:DMT family transporter [Chitinophaga sp.]HVI48659.1 DMT family transporter [Chitinophaga sp.]
MTRYILMVFVGACSFGILSTFVKLAYTEGYTAAEISVSQAFTGMVVLWLLSQLFTRNTSAPTEQLKERTVRQLLFTGAALGLTTFVYYLSVQYIPASVAIVLLMQFTWMGMLLEWLVFGKKPARMQALITLVILTGTVLSAGLLNAQASVLPLKGIVYALASALLYAVYILANSRTGNQLHPLKKSRVIMAGSTLGIFVANAHQLIGSPHFDMGLLKWVLSLSLFGTILPPLLFARGIPKIGAGISGIIMTAELPVAVICSHIVLHEPVDVWQWTGVVIMLIAIALQKVIV